MSGHGPWAEPEPAGGAAPAGGVAAADEPVPDELLVPVEPEPVEVDGDVLAGVVAVVDCVVAALEAMVPMPSPRPAVPAMTPRATTAFLNRECMSHLPCRVRGSSLRDP
jgi:hypothetical protein